MSFYPLTMITLYLKRFNKHSSLDNSYAICYAICMKHYQTKNQRIYREVTITDRLRLNIKWHKWYYGCYPKKIFITKEIMKEYMDWLPPFQDLFYKGLSIVTNKGPTFRGVELVLNG